MVRFYLHPRRVGRPNNYEMVEIADAGGYPASMIHIDCFHSKSDMELYEALRKGHIVEVALTILSKQED